MNKFAIISLVLIFVTLIILKVNFFWLAVLAVATSFFIRKHLQLAKQNQTNEEILKKGEELEKSSPKITIEEEKAE